jgi:hypoxanthine phosphoribosyltransferase
MFHEQSRQPRIEGFPSVEAEPSAGARPFDQSKIEASSSSEVPYDHEKHVFGGYQILNTPELRTKYLTLTDDLICKMAEQQTEVAVYLDKSARPVAWMVHAFWDQLAPQNEDGSTPSEPKIKFLNIDREQWSAVTGRTEDDNLDVKAIPRQRIDELRKVLAVKGVHIDENKPHNGPSELDGKRVMVIDEVSVSGDTLRLAEGVLRRAFPNTASQKGEYWMQGRVKTDRRTSVARNTELPIWYSDKVTTGRGVADRDTTKSQQSNSVRQRIGGYWLSTNFREPDEKGLQLRKEIDQMAEDLKVHDMVYKPSIYWPREPRMKRVERLNGVPAELFLEMLKETGHNAEQMQERVKKFASEVIRRVTSE